VTIEGGQPWRWDDFQPFLRGEASQGGPAIQSLATVVRFLEDRAKNGAMLRLRTPAGETVTSRDGKLEVESATRERARREAEGLSGGSRACAVEIVK
jgi:hypothetical protein